VSARRRFRANRSITRRLSRAVLAKRILAFECATPIHPPGDAMTPPRRAAVALAAALLLGACKASPKQPDQPPPPNPIKAQINAGRAGARSADSAINASQDRMNAQAAEAAGDTTAKQE
jgi:hypothetical protein